MWLFQASYSVLSQWSQGNYDDAIKSYFKLERKDTPALLQGREWHEKFEKEATTNKQIPLIFRIDKDGNEKDCGKLLNPVTEQFLSAKLADWLELRGKIDLYDGDLVIDWKTGANDPDNRMSRIQIGCYAILGKLNDLDFKRGEIYHYNQYTKKASYHAFWITPDLLEETIDWVQTVASEMYHYLVENNLFERFSKNRI